MLETEVYIKTDAGRDEIRSRALGLPMATRAILLMVDGHRTVAAMRALIAGSKATPDVLDLLVAQGLIAPRSGAAPVPRASPDPGAPAAASIVAADEPERAPVGAAVVASAPLAAPVYDGPIDLLLPTIYGPQADPTPPASAGAAPLPEPDRYEHLYRMMNEIVRDFLAPHRRFFFQLKIERCTTADALVDLLLDLQTVLAKARGEAFASEVIARLRSAVG